MPPCVTSKKKNADASQELRDLAKKENLALKTVELDVTDDASVEHAVQEVVKQAGRIDVLVNNAGIGSYGAFEAFSMEQVLKNIRSQFFWRCAHRQGRTDRICAPTTTAC